MSTKLESADAITRRKNILREKKSELSNLKWEYEKALDRSAPSSEKMQAMIALCEMEAWVAHEEAISKPDVLQEVKKE